MSCNKPIEFTLNVILDVSEVPELEQWGKEAQQLLMESECFLIESVKPNQDRTDLVWK